MHLVPFNSLKAIMPFIHTSNLYYCLQDIVCDPKQSPQRLKMFLFGRWKVVKLEIQQIKVYLQTSKIDNTIMKCSPLLVLVICEVSC